MVSNSQKNNGEMEKTKTTEDSSIRLKLEIASIYLKEASAMIDELINSLDNGKNDDRK